MYTVVTVNGTCTATASIAVPHYPRQFLLYRKVIVCYDKNMTPFEQILQKYRDISFSERDKSYRFERLMQSFLKTYLLYEGQFTSI